jgi:thioredoxin reductase
VLKPQDRHFAFKVLELIKKRKRALLLSLALPGAGQLYLGRRATGALFMLLFFLPFYYLYAMDFPFNYGTLALLFSQLSLYVLQLADVAKGESRETSPCEDACPAGVLIPSFMAYCERGEPEEALGVFMLRAPFAFTLGELCSAPCEGRCGVLVPRPVKVKEVHRLLGKMFLESFVPKPRDPFFPPVGKKVAVVGAGPAGITSAYYIASAGVDVEIFEKEEKLGGMLNIIPDFKFNKSLVEKEIQFLTSFKNIKVFTGAEIKEITEDYSAVVVAIGYQIEKKLNIPIDSASSIVYPTAFLRNPPAVKGRKVVILGGGNTAFDIARFVAGHGGTALVLYRGNWQTIKVSRREVELAIKEGVLVRFNCTPVSVSGGRIRLSCGEETFDYLVPAIGFERDEKLIASIVESARRVRAKVYVVEDSSSVVSAVAGARKVAESVLKDIGLAGRVWFSTDLYVPKAKSTLSATSFLSQEGKLCQHCGVRVRS